MIVGASPDSPTLADLPVHLAGSRQLGSRVKQNNEQLTNLLSHLFAVHDHIDQAMLLQKFSGLKLSGNS